MVHFERLARIAQELAPFAPALSRSSLAWHGGVRHGPGTGLSRAARASGPASRRRTDELAGKDSKQDCSSRLEKLRGSWKSTTLGRAGGATRRRSQSSRRRWLRCQSMWRCQSSRLWRRLPRYLQFSKFTLFRLFFRMFFLEHVLPRACSSGPFLMNMLYVVYLMNMLYVVYLPIYQVSMIMIAFLPPFFLDDPVAAALISSLKASNGGVAANKESSLPLLNSLPTSLLL